jgi:CDP-glycerol glycerophosphotransferase (TagB/SpsB family)
MNKENLLIIVYDSISNEKLKKLIIDNKEYNVILASYSIQFLENTKNIDGVFNSILMEDNITIFDISDKVINLCENINLSLKNYIEPGNILHYQKHVEGGYTSARVQNLLILEIIITNLFVKHKISKIIDVIDDYYILDSSLIKSYSKNNNIYYKRLTTYTIVSIKNKIFYHVKPYLHEPYRFIRFLKFNLIHKKKARIEKKGSVVLSLNSDSIKFIELYSSLYEKLKKINIKYFFITSGVDKNSTRVEDIKDKIFMREHYESLADYFISLFKVFNFMIRLLINKNNIVNDLRIKDRFIKDELLNTLKFHIVIDTGYRYRYKKSINLFLKENKNNILCFKLWGETSLIEGEIANLLIKKYYNSIKTLGFEVGIGLKTFPYVPSTMQEIDFIITSSDLETELYKYYGVDPNNILQLKKFKNQLFIDDFKKCTSILDSKKALDIDKDYKKYILVDVSVAERGYQSVSEIHDLILFLPLLAKRYSDYLFLIKPHPGSNNKTYLTKKINMDNIIVYDKVLSILHFLNVSDVLITKYSAIGVEAILFDKLVISILPDTQKGFKAYDDAAIYVKEKEEIYEIFDNLEVSILERATKQSKYKQKLINEKNSSTIECIIQKIQGL